MHVLEEKIEILQYKSGGLREMIIPESPVVSFNLFL